MTRRKTHEEFVKEVHGLVGNDYSVIGNYVRARDKIKMRHNKCRYEYEVKPNQFLNGRRCPNCSGNMKKTTEQFEEEVYNLVGDEYKVVGEYINTNTKIKVKHVNCGVEYEVLPYIFLSGTRCSKCSGNMKKTTEQFKEEVYDLVRDEYNIVGEYINADTKIGVRHELCGYEYKVSPINFLRGSRCPKCSGKMRKTTEVFKKEVEGLVGNDYNVLGTYVNSHTKIKMMHEDCGNVYEVNPRNFLQGNRCPKCQGVNKKTNEEFKEDVYSLVGNEYKVLDDYVNTRTKIRIKHSECGSVYKVTPGNFLRGNRCANCYNKNRIMDDDKFKVKFNEVAGEEFILMDKYEGKDIMVKLKHKLCGTEFERYPKYFLKTVKCPKCDRKGKKTTLQFKEDVYRLVGDEYKILEDYKGFKTKIEMEHTKCRKVYKVVPSSFLNGSRCPNCYGNIKKTTEDFKKDIYDLVEDEYEVIGEYINNRTKIDIKHHKCGNIISIKPVSFLNGNRCVHCSGKKKKTTEEFKEEVYNLVGEDYVVIGEYTGTKKPVEMLHVECGRTWMATPYDFIYSGCRCGNCFKSHKITTEEFKERVYELVGDEYEVLGDYNNNRTKIKIKHELCGKSFDVLPKSFLHHGTRCKFCYSFKGESKVIFALESYGIKYVSHLNIRYKNGRYGFVDIMVYNEKGETCLGIEYDGIQHFKPVEVFGGEEALKDTQERDKLKDNWFKENNIPLLRIAYWDYDNIEDILSKKLIELGLIKDKI